jgi:hypothetical protein
VTAYRHGSNVISDVVDGHLTLCNTTSGEVLELNGTGAALWTWCDNATAEALTAQLLEAYPTMDADVVRDDVEEWLSAAEAAGLLQVDDPTTVA